MNNIANVIADSAASEFSSWLLNSVPGLPPILQTVHLLSVSAIMASIIMLDMRILGVALPSQTIPEMVRRLQPWAVTGLAGLFFSGIWFVLARPSRYFSNPVFQIKFTLLMFAVLFTVILIGLLKRRFRRVVSSNDRTLMIKFFAGCSLTLWLGVMMAGRWIAYSEYLFWQG